MEAATLTAAGEMHCPKCDHTQQPNLVELYLITHSLRRIDGKTIAAVGWNGDHHDIAEQGEGEMLECAHCFERYALSEGVTIDWL